MAKTLITGVTGFLGGGVLSKRLSQEGSANLLLLARGNSQDHALARIKSNLTKFGASEMLLDTLTPDQVINGDLAVPEGFIKDARLEQVTHVINCAAVASFGDNPAIWRVNVEGTFAFAKRMSQVSGLRRFLHVGTAMSCAPAPGDHVHERFSEQAPNAHIVPYTQSKAAIEQKMLTELPTLPLVIARPSIVVGHTHMGCTPSSSIYWVFKMALAISKFTCALEDRVDVIPVDYCADALLYLNDCERVKKEVYHISAGKTQSVTFSDIDHAVALAENRAPISSHYQQVDFSYFVAIKKQLSSFVGDCNERLILKAIGLYGQFATLNVTFDNDKLLNLGMPQPCKFTDYIGKCADSTRDMSIMEMMAVDFK